MEGEGELEGIGRELKSESTVWKKKKKKNTSIFNERKINQEFLTKKFSFLYIYPS